MSSLAADAARQHLLSGVEPHVQVQVPLPQVGLSAILALKVGLLCLFLLQIKSNEVQGDPSEL